MTRWRGRLARAALCVGAKFLQAKTKILNTCWDAKLKDKEGLNDGVRSGHRPEAGIRKAAPLVGRQQGGGITVTSLQSYIARIDCVLEFKADCLSNAGIGDDSPALGIDDPAQ